MKIRQDFVTNSSSTSYVIKYKKDKYPNFYDCEICNKLVKILLDNDYLPSYYDDDNDIHKISNINNVNDYIQHKSEDSYDGYDKAGEYKKLIEEIENGFEVVFLDINRHTNLAQLFNILEENENIQIEKHND